MKPLLLFLSILGLVACSPLDNAKPAKVLFDKSYDVPGDDHAGAIAINADGALFLASETHFGKGAETSQDITILKTDAQGLLQNSNTLDLGNVLPDRKWEEPLAIDASGPAPKLYGYVFTPGTSDTNQVFALSGDIFSTSPSLAAANVPLISTPSITLADDGFYFYGSYTDYSSPYAVRILKYDTALKIHSDQESRIPSSNHYSGIQAITGPDHILIPSTSGDNHTSSDTTLHLVDSAGDPQLIDVIQRPNSRLTSLAISPRGQQLFGGETGKEYKESALLIALDPQGAILWEKTFKIGTATTVQQIAVAGDKGWFIIGSGDDSKLRKTIVWAAFVDPDGEIQWSWSKPSPTTSYDPPKIALSKNRGFLLTQGYEATAEKDLNLICFELFPQTEY